MACSVNGMLCCAVLCYTILMLFYAVLCCALPCHALLCYHAVLCYSMPCYAMSCSAMPCHAMLCYTNVMLCYVMLSLCWDMLRYDMLMSFNQTTNRFVCADIHIHADKDKWVLQMALEQELELKVGELERNTELTLALANPKQFWNQDNQLFAAAKSCPLNFIPVYLSGPTVNVIHVDSAHPLFCCAYLVSWRPCCSYKS